MGHRGKTILPQKKIASSFKFSGKATDYFGFKRIKVRTGFLDDIFKTIIRPISASWDGSTDMSPKPTLVNGNVSPYPYATQSEYTAWYNEAIGSYSMTAPTADSATLINDLIGDLKSINAWGKADLIQIFALKHSVAIDFSTTFPCSPIPLYGFASNTMQPNPLTAFSGIYNEDLGLAGNALIANYNAFTPVRYQQNSATIAFYHNGSGFNNSPLGIASDANFKTAGLNATILNNGVTPDALPVASASGFSGMTRVDSVNVTVRTGGVTTTGSLPSSQVPSNGNTIALMYDTFTSQVVAGNLGFAFIGAGMSASDLEEMETIVNRYFNELALL